MKLNHASRWSYLNTLLILLTSSFNLLFLFSNVNAKSLIEHNSSTKWRVCEYFPQSRLPHLFDRDNKLIEKHSIDNSKKNRTLPLPSPIRIILQNSASNLIYFLRSKHILNGTPCGIPTPCLATAAIAIPIFQLRRKDFNDYSKPKMEPKLAPTNPVFRAFAFWKRAGPIVVHYKFTKRWCKFKEYPFETRDVIWNSLHDQYAEEVKDIMTQFRGLFVKFGQVLSGRADFMPRQYIEAFTSLQDDLPPKPFEEIKNIVQESLYEIDDNLTFDEVFESFDESPLGTASIGQVHAAVLSSRLYNITTNKAFYKEIPEVAVKVMHPSAQDQFRNDFKIFKWLCRVGLPGWMTLLDELKRQMMTEFDYTDEANSLQEIRMNMKKTKYSKFIQIPEPVTNLCHKNLLVMEMLRGKKLSDHFEYKLAEALNGDMKLAKKIIRRKHKELLMGPLLDREKDTDDSKQALSWMTAMNEILTIVNEERDDKRKNPLLQAHLLMKMRSMRNEIKKSLDLLVNVHGHQIFVNGVFNSDPHPGNILQLEDGRLGLIDYGQVKRLNVNDRMVLSDIIIALGESENIEDSDQTRIADAMRDFGFESLRNKNDVIAMTAELYFDSNSYGSALGYPNPQGYFQYLSSLDPMVKVPTSAVMVARTSFLFRGMGALLQQDIKTAKYWKRHAKVAIQNNRQSHRK